LTLKREEMKQSRDERRSQKFEIRSEGALDRNLGVSGKKDRRRNKDIKEVN